MNLQNRLFASLSIMAATAIAIGALSLFTLKGVFDGQGKVYNSGLASYHLKKIADSYSDVIASVKKVQNGDTWAWEEGSKVMTEAQKTADENWTAYLAMDKTKDEKYWTSIAGSQIDTNKHMMEDLKNDFVSKDLRDLTIQASGIDPSLGPILENLRKLEDINQKIGQDAIAQAEKGFNESFEFIAGVIVILLVAGLVAAFWVGSWGMRSMSTLSMGFGRNIEQVAGQSEQVSAATSQLSSHLLESAANIQKTENAVERLVYVAQQNKQETTLAKHYLDEAKTAITMGGESAQRTLNYMKNMGQGSEKVSQIVKTIEEIAFQTNILALNAGVEAVRAGDQGKEFVLVVEEIRNLSQRCSQVARETSKLVTDNVNQTNEGARLSEETGKAIHQAFELSGKAMSLLTVIEGGLELQANNLHEIHSSAGNAEQEAYRNSAIGEKLGSLGLGLSQQAEGLRQVSHQLSGLLQGSSVKTAPMVARAKVAPEAAPAAPAAAEQRVANAETQVMERTGTDDAKIIHMNK